MRAKLPLSEAQKLVVLHRIESGCLGPQGDAHIDEFCQYAERSLADVDADFVRWQVHPRSNKSKPEVQYLLAGKSLCHDKAARYLALFKKDLDEFECHYSDKMVELITHYLGH